MLGVSQDGVLPSRPCRSINYRGSISFGRAFQSQIYHDIGHWKIEDIVAARMWLIKEGIALSKAIFLTG